MKIKIFERDIRLFLKGKEIVMYRWFPFEIRLVRYGNGTNEDAARRLREFRVAAKQAHSEFLAEMERRKTGGEVGVDRGAGEDGDAGGPGVHVPSAV